MVLLDGSILLHSKALVSENEQLKVKEIMIAAQSVFSFCCLEKQVT